MKNFEHINAKTIEEASYLLDVRKNSHIIAGGTDLLGSLKDDIFYPDYPDLIINLKSIPGLSYIKEEGGVLKIGALTVLEDIVHDEVVKAKYNCLWLAALRTASPHLREMGTIAGNICQQNRCWYFRNPNNRFDCLRKNPKGLCYALTGDNRYHSIFGAVKGCIAVNPSDIAPALVALNATIETNKRSIPIDEFFAVETESSTVLDSEEIIIEIQIPSFSGKSSFQKFSLRKSIDFPIVNCAVAITNNEARICLNAVYNLPYRTESAENIVKGKNINEEIAVEAAASIKSKSLTLEKSKYKLHIAQTLIKRTLMECK
jgi:xanthine dehydrogenase YagS FAD-binding subunit